MTLAFLDADVLAQATPRTILYLASALDEPAFGLIYSPHVEQEAERAQRPGARPVSILRHRHLWDIGPDHADPSSLRFTDTHVKDQPVLAAAIANQARILITGNVRDFGHDDLAHYGISTVHPGLFLAHRLTKDIYAHILDTLASSRSQPPNTSLAIHIQNVSDELPDLFERFKDAFGPADSVRTKGPLKEVFRGVACVRCGSIATNAVDLANGIGACCTTPA